ncbi:hypothetical protein TSUD_406330 [Trifolium subterraneum]|uniref:Retrotransposon gag domain-containing protein n=1 Tax=Trifolium subterraneum TaxID=3900 RepID=A0A2Z6PE09_TRISU|nr:hypothetical protein TSUD_406330 [Trifolium subterraneum]
MLDIRQEGNVRGSGDERHRGPLSRRIMDIPLPRGLEKPPSLDKYDGTTDPDEHIQSVETALDYRNLRGAIKCKLFSLSLIRGASTWWRNLPPDSIDSWEELCRMFTAHFTTSQRHSKTVANLKAIIQGPEESLRSYIERFNKVSVEVDTTDKIKLYLLVEGLHEGTKFQDREERRGDEKKRDSAKVREAKPPKGQFTYYTPLNAPRDRILSEVSNAEFKSVGIRFPKQLPEKPNMDKKKLCRFHKSYGHVTDDCVHLKNAIEILIQKGYTRQYVDGQPRTANDPPRQNQLVVDPASPEQNVEEDNKVIGGVALAISRPEDFLPLPNNEEKEALDYLVAHLDGSWENFPGAFVISGGGFNPVTIGSIKRKFDELEKASLVGEIKITESKNGQLRREKNTRRSRNSCDIMVQRINNKALGIHGPNRYLGENKAMKSLKVNFLVVDCTSLYNCIIGRPTLAELFAVSSTIHLKLKYYTKDGYVTTINGDIEAAR